MTEPFQAEPPIGPDRQPNLLEQIQSWVRKLLPTSPTVRTLLVCSHRYANGASAWSACTWDGSYWESTCARCGLKARCR